MNVKRIHLVRVFVVIIPPILFTWYLFPPLSKYELNLSGNGSVFVPQEQIRPSLTRSFVATFFESSLDLGWYKICWKNDGALHINGETFTKEEAERPRLIPGTAELDIEAVGTIGISISELRNDKIISEYYLESGPSSIDCSVMNRQLDGLSYQSEGTTTVNLGRMGNIETIKTGQQTNEGKDLYEFSVGVDFTKLSLTIYNYLPAIFFKLTIIFILWSSTILLFKNLWDFIKKNETKVTEK